MYNVISEKFRDQSKQLNNRTAIVLMSILSLILIIFVCVPVCVYHKNYAKWFIPLWFGVVIIFCLLYCYVIIFLSIRKEPQFLRKNWWDVISMIRLYAAVTHNKDIQILIKILKEQGVNTRPKVLEVLRHYQCLLPRNTIGKSQFISILALSISILAFVFNNIITMPLDYLLITILCILAIICIYVLGYALNKKIFHFFGETALITRIEMAVSEIWMKSLIK